MDRRFPGFGPERPADAAAVSRDRDAALGPDRVVEARHALLIGNGAYRQAALRNPRRDVRLVGAALEQLGFAVTRLEDGDLAALHDALATFVATLRDSGPDTVALVYFAGHGVQADGVNYLIPAHADIPGPRDLGTRALALDKVVAMLAGSPRRANILVLDACRDRASGDDAGPRHGFSGGLASLALPPAGMLVAYSTAAGMAADDGRGAHSPYATALVEVLPGLLEPGRKVHDIFVEAAERVRAATGGRQSPALFLQGGLPALTLAPEDASRRARYDPRGRARALTVASLTGAGLLTALLAGFAVLVWTQMAPIDRRAWMAKAGLAAPPGAGLSCAAPPETGPVDRFGLSPADWCGLMPAELHRKAQGRDDLPGAIAAGVAAGDPGALFLQAMEAARQDPSLPGPLAESVAFDLDRASRNGVAVAAIFWDELARRQILLPRPDLLDAAARDGHVLSQARLAVAAVERGDVATGVAALESLRARDPTGFVPHLLALVLAGTVSPRADVDLGRSDALTREAARKGYLPAIDRLLGLQADGTLDLAPEETAAMMQRLFEAGREEGLWWEVDRLLETGSPESDRAALALLRGMMVAFPGGDAAWQFARLATQGIGGPVAAGELAQAVDLAISAGSPLARTLRGELRMGLVTGPDRLPLLPIDPAGALADLQASLALTGDPRALQLLARYHLLGVGGTPDPQAALPFLRMALAGPEEAPSGAIHLQAAVARMAALAGSHSPADIDLGDPTAPVTVTILFDPACPACQGADHAADLGALADWLRATYVRAGFVRLDLRPVAPGPAPSEALQRLTCAGTPQDAAALQRLFAPSAAAIAGEVSCPGDAGTDQVAQANRDRLALMRSEVFARDAAIAPDDLPDSAGDPGAAAARPRDVPPVVVVNGWIVPSPDHDRVEATVFRLLSPARQVRALAEGALGCRHVLATADPDEGESLLCLNP